MKENRVQRQLKTWSGWEGGGGGGGALNYLNTHIHRRYKHAHHETKNRLSGLGAGGESGQSVRFLTCTFRASYYSTRLSWAHTPVINWVVCLGQMVSS